MLSISITMFAYSQNTNRTSVLRGKPASLKMKAVKAQTVTTDKIPFRTHTQPKVRIVETGMHATSTFTEAIIGITSYDLQSNRSTPKRISNNGDGTLSAVWTMSTIVGSTTWADRGTGYNYFDGTNWGAAPTGRIEPIRTGNTNIDVSPAGEFVSAHTGAQGILQSSRITKGVGTWDTSSVGSFNLYPGEADVWSRLAVGSTTGNTVHVIMNGQGTGSTSLLGQDGPLLYCRSLDGGATWVDNHIQIPGTDSTFMDGEIGRAHV